LTTAYQTVPVVLTINGEARKLSKINLTINVGSVDGTGVLQLDGTACKEVDPWGEPSVCKPGVYAPEDVRLAGVKMLDPTGRQRRLYAILEGSPEEQLYIVVPTLRCDSYRLTIQTAPHVHRVITMEFVPGTCPKVKPVPPPAKRRCCRLRRARR